MATSYSYLANYNLYSYKANMNLTTQLASQRLFLYFQKRGGLVATDVEGATKAIAQIKGFVVEYPPEFLKDQEMKKTVIPLRPAFYQ